MRRRRHRRIGVFTAFLVFELSSAVAAASPINYLFLDGGPVGQWNELLKRDDIGGAQVVYDWRALEPSKGRYDFSSIERDLAVAQALHKQLFIQVQDRFFEPGARNVPDYLLRERQYGGGLAKQADSGGEGHSGGSGWVTKQWNPAVRVRFQALLGALGKRFDGRIAGVNLPETAADLTSAEREHGFSCDAYFDGELENLAFARRVFRRSAVVQYVNFWPCGWNNAHGYMQRTFEFAVKNGVGLGGPDIAPFQKAHMHNAYPFFHQYKGRLKLVAMAVQEPTLTYTNPTTGKRSSRDDILQFASDYLGVDVIFWTPEAPWLRTAK
jgi:hypothetical protein